MDKGFEWTSIDTGEIIKRNERHLKKCPRCNDENLLFNRYKDLYVTDTKDNYISICINMAYCNECSELYVRNDY